LLNLILAVDPGNVTGVALFDPNEPSARPVTREIQHKDDVYRSINKLKYDASVFDIVAERFVISQRTIKSERQTDALDILGYLDSLRALYGLEFTLQTAAQAKRFCPDGKLRSLGWYERTKDGHANDALRHLFTYLASAHRNTPGVEGLLKRSLS
jgi:hypothetical protein